MTTYLGSLEPELDATVVRVSCWADENDVGVSERVLMNTKTRVQITVLSGYRSRSSRRFEGDTVQLFEWLAISQAIAMAGDQELDGSQPSTMLAPNLDIE